MSPIFYLPNLCDIERKLRSVLPSSAAAEWQQFPSGEWHLVVSGVQKHCWVIGRVWPDADSLWQTLLLLDTLKRHGATSISLVLPYLSYARQDRLTLPGECLSSAALLKLCYSVGADNILTIDLHSQRIINDCSHPLINLDPTPLFAASLAPFISGADTTVLSPDKGGIVRAEALRQQLGITNTLAWIEKRRYQNRVVADALHGQLCGDVVIMVDDIIDTGGTLLLALELAQGARQCWICATHALCSGDRIQALVQNPKVTLLVGNTLPLPEALYGAQNVFSIDLSGLLCEAIQHIARADQKAG